MNQPNNYLDLLNKKSKVVQLIEMYKAAGIFKFADKYIMLKWSIDKDIQKAKREVFKIDEQKRKIRSIN